MLPVLIPGGAGFIGSAMVLHLVQHHPEVPVVVLDLLTYAGNLENLKAAEAHPNYHFVHGDICDQALVESLFQRYGIGRVINLCAESHVDRSIADPDSFARTNIMGALSLLTAAKNHWLKGGRWREGVLFLQVSTDEVYGALGKTGHFSPDSPLSPRSPYAASKAAADLLVKSFGDTYAMPVCVTRSTNNLGPRQHPEKLIPLVINNALHRREIPVYGSGQNVRDWLWVEDHVAALWLALTHGAPGQVYNIGAGQERTTLQVVQATLSAMAQQTGGQYGNAALAHVTDRPGHDFRYAVDATKTRRQLGWTPALSFEEAISRTVHWYLANPSWLDNMTSGAYRDYYQKMYHHRDNPL